MYNSKMVSTSGMGHTPPQINDSARFYLIYNDSVAAQPETALRSLLQEQHFAFHVTRRAGELESMLRKTKYSHLILLLGNSVSRGLERALANTRNLANARDLKIAAVHKSYNDYDVQKALMLGVRYLYVLPFDLKWLLDPPPIREFAHFDIGPVPCEIDTFGRIGKITKEPLGNLQIETDLKLDVGAHVDVLSLIAKDLGLPALKMTVLKDHGVDHYYQYSYAYHLKWESTVDLRAKLDQWLRDHKSEFTLPKTKILFVTEKMHWEWENVLPKGVFSVYVENPKKISVTALELLNPRIVVFEEHSNDLLEVLKDWASKNPEPPKIIRKWISGEEAKFVQEIHDQLRVRVAQSIVGAHYLARKSPYSRFGVRMKGEIVSAAQHYFRMRTPHPVSIGTVLRVFCPFLDDAKHSVIFARVVENHQGIAECCVIPEGENPNRTLTELKVLFDASEKQKIEAPEPLLKQEADSGLFFLEAVKEAEGLFSWIVSGVKKIFR